MSVRFRCILAWSAVICWASAITIAVTAPNDVSIRCYILLVGCAITCTNGAWIGTVITPLVASQETGIRAGARYGREIGKRTGRHQKQQQNDESRVVVPLPLRRLMRIARTGGS